MSKRQLLKRLGCAFVLLLAFGLLAGCGGSESGSSSDSVEGATTEATATTEETAASSVVTEADKVVEEGYGTGLTEPPPTSGPPAQEGKKVWFISCGESYESCHNMTGAFTDAAKGLGWDLNVCDGEANPAVAGACIRQALAAGAEGIALVNYNCPDIKGPLLAAQHANIPVVNYSGLDCNNKVFGGKGQPLFAAGTKIFGDETLNDYFEKWGETQANYIIAKTQGKATILDIHEITAPALIVAHEAFLRRLQKCEECEVIDVPFNFADFPNPALQQIKSAILANPDANVISSDVDSLFSGGLATAITQSGRDFDLIAGAEGNSTNMQLIREGKQSNSVARADPQHIWGLADTLNRLFAGETKEQLPSEGGGMQIIDEEHNLPSTNSPYDSAIEYRKLYEKVWDGSEQ